MPIYKQGAVAHVAALLLFVESKNKKHVFVKIKACATDFLENQKFSMSISDDNSKTYTTIGEYSIANETLNLKEESGKEFALAFDGKNAILNTEETYMLFSADTAAGNAEQA